MNCRGMPGMQASLRVSIHIRHCWRMNFAMQGVTDFMGSRFNPHSPLLANEFSEDGRTGSNRGVSIHIRHCWRMNSHACSGAGCTGGFNPHSPLLANEFQLLQSVTLLFVCFNPHSPLLANELNTGSATCRSGYVSIHIRHCWRMN